MTGLVRRLRETRGSGDVAAICVVVPLAFALVLLFVYFGRQGVAAEGVTHAAAVAARAASMEHDVGSARAAAQSAAAATLAEEGMACAGGPGVGIDASGWQPGGVVVVTVTCQVAGIADIGASSRTVSGTARATIDRFADVEI